MRIAALTIGLGLWLAAAAAHAAPEQDGFVQWTHAAAGRAREVQAFEAFLRHAGVSHVLPVSELLLDASSWRTCADAPYSLPPRALWPNVVPTLRFIRAHVIPALGPVDAVSGYRSPELNACAGGAPQSAHARYYALDLTPVHVADRGRMIATMCQLHARFGQHDHVGLGFYQGLRFHVDTAGYRRWGSDYHSDTSPCAVLEARR